MRFESSALSIKKCGVLEQTLGRALHDLEKRVPPNLVLTGRMSLTEPIGPNIQNANSHGFLDRYQSWPAYYLVCYVVRLLVECSSMELSEMAA